MKRIFAYITMLTLAVACETMYGPVETPIAPDSAAGVEITVADVTDDSFTVTITPAGEASYYSWLIDEASAAVELDAETLYAVGYESVGQGTAKWTAEKPSVTFTVEGLDPNTDYQIYAVAGSKMGIAGAVVNKSVKTTDTVAPGYESFETDANQVVFTFSEAVTRKAENGAIKVPYYAYYSAEFQTTAAAAGEVTVPEDSILVAGNQALISVPDLPTGCYWTISIPEGAFVDVVGQKLPAYASPFVMVEGEDGPEPAPKGFYGEIDYVELPMLGELELETFAEWDAGFAVPLVNKYPLANFSTKKFVTVTYEVVKESSVETVVHTLAPSADYNVTSLGFVVNLPEEPAVGANVTISVPAGALYDIYGNDCEAWEHTMKYSYGYTLEDILGTYVFQEQSLFDGQIYPSELVVAKSDDEEEGNVMFTVYDDIECNISPIYAQFDVDAGTLTVPSLQLFGEYTNSKGTEYLAAFVSAVIDYTAGTVGYSTAPVVFKVESPNVITATAPYGVLLCDLEGKPASWYDAYVASQAKLAPAATASTTASVARLGYSLNASFVRTF